MEQNELLFFVFPALQFSCRLKKKKTTILAVFQVDELELMESDHKSQSTEGQKHVFLSVGAKVNAAHTHNIFINIVK